MTPLYVFSGVVSEGKKEGRRYNKPTANIALPKDLKIEYGVYAATVEMENRKYMAVTNIGHKPTFSDFTKNCESYILNFSGDIYGKTLTVSLYERLRDIKKFSEKEALAKQISLDEENAKAILSHLF